MPARYLVGIDLGTTNCALAYVDSADRAWGVCDFPIQQLVAPNTVERRDGLPSVHYEPAVEEMDSLALSLPWTAPDASPAFAVGLLAGERGSSAPHRTITSMKSWLSHSGVDRTAALLPWHGTSDVSRLSPVEASARLLDHLRSAWDHAFPEHPLSQQELILTVPAGFDEVARELTVQAAILAGVGHAILVEEPQAAFYAWINAHRDDWHSRVSPGDRILICDVGGGTSDFSLIRVKPAGDGKVMFHRVAVGEHLILGGDNLDLALAHHLESKLGGELDPRAWGALLRSARRAKETMLADESLASMTVNIAGGGSGLIGGSRQVELSAAEVEGVLVEGFLPACAIDESPSARRSGFQEFGLPYAPDPGITRYLAAFLRAHRDAGIDPGERRSGQDPLRPEWILFNGGLFESPRLRKRLLEVMGGWFGGAAPRVLDNDRLDLAVARGAAYYAMVRRGLGTRIAGGSAHSYYVGIESADSTARAVCLLPAGIEEGHGVDLLDRQFTLRIREPVEFPLYQSSLRTTDAPGAVLAVDPLAMTALPPIRTVLQSGRKSAADTVTVTLHVRRTEIGTLELWCAEAVGSRRWKLQFDVRSPVGRSLADATSPGASQGTLDEQTVARGTALIRATFMRSADRKTESPQSLMGSLERVSQIARADWPATLMRTFWETLMEVEPGRAICDAHEIRWLNLTGYCLRPGYGLAVDDWRVGQTWKLFAQRLRHPRNEQSRAEWWILWRRLAGGLTQGQQQTLAEPLLAEWRTWLRKSGQNVRGRDSTFQFGNHESTEVWRLLGSLELLDVTTKLELGGMALELIGRGTKMRAIRAGALFALGRLGARTPVYGPLNALVPRDTAGEWAIELMRISGPASTPETAFTLMQLTRRTHDRHRDVDDPTRAAAIEHLQGAGASEHLISLISSGGELAAVEQRAAFGESLPRGLRIE